MKTARIISFPYNQVWVMVSSRTYQKFSSIGLDLDKLNQVDHRQFKPTLLIGILIVMDLIKIINPLKCWVHGSLV